MSAKSARLKVADAMAELLKRMWRHMWKRNRRPLARLLPRRHRQLLSLRQLRHLWQLRTPSATAAPAPMGNRPEQRVAMSRLRARIAERLVQSQSTAAILTTFNEVNMQAIMDLRARYKVSLKKNMASSLASCRFLSRRRWRR